MNHRIVLRGIVALALSLLLSAGAHAQSIRTYISSGGNDANPCTLAAPCRLLSTALVALIDGGEIWMLDSANYSTSPVNVNKSVSILAVPGAVGSVMAIGGNAINIGTAGVKVALRNLVIAPFVGGGSTGGINMTAGASLTVEKCLIANLPGSGIFVSASGASVLVTDTIIRGNGNAGLYVSNGARATVARAIISGNTGTAVLAEGTVSSTTTADIADSTMDANLYGVVAHSGSGGALVKVSVRNSQVVRNSTAGVAARSDASAATTLSVSNSIISNNGTGVLADSAGARVWASGNTVSDNATGLLNSGGLLESASDNAVRNNGANASVGISPVSKM